MSFILCWKTLVSLVAGSNLHARLVELVAPVSVLADLLAIPETRCLSAALAVALSLAKFYAFSQSPNQF